MALPLASIIAGATGAIQLGSGLLNNRRRPNYVIPKAAATAMRTAQMQAQDGMMDGYQLAADQINLQSSNALQAAMQSGNAQQSVASIAASQGTQSRQLAQMNEQATSRETSQYLNTLNMMSGFEDQRFQMNQFAPFADIQRERRDMIGGGLENLFQSVNFAHYMSLMNKNNR